MALPKTDNETEKWSKSCDHCKLKKIKCDQTQPACSKCEKYGVDCVYSVKRKPGLRKGYGKSVLDQLDDMHGIIIQNRKDIDRDVEILKQEKDQQRDQIRMLQERLDLFISQTPKIGMEDHTSTGTIFDQPSFHEPSPKRQSTSTALTLHSSSGLTISTRVLLIKLYFDYVHPVFPILHPVLDREKIDSNPDIDNMVVVGIMLNGLRFVDKTLDESQIKSYSEQFKNSIILQCFGMRTTSQLTAMALLAFHSYSMSNNPDTWSVISLVTNGCIHLGINHEPSARDTANYLTPPQNLPTHNSGLGDPSSVDEWTRWAEEETQRNLFWEIYTLDRLASIASFFSPKLPQKDIDRVLPVNYSYWEVPFSDQAPINNHQSKSLTKPETQYGFLYDTNCYIIEVVHLLGCIQEFMKDPIQFTDIKCLLNWEIAFSELEDQIKAWKENLPKTYIDFLDSDSYSLNRQLTIKDVIFHALYHTMLIRLNSAVGFPSFNEKMLILASVAREKCLQSGSIIASTAKRLPDVFLEYGDSIHQYLGPYYAFSLWVCGRVLLVHSLNSKTPVPEELDDIVDILRNIGTTWECAVRYADILEFFKNDNQEMPSISDFDEFSPRSERQEDASLISDMRLHAASLEALLSKKVDRYKSVKGSPAHNNDMSIFDWFKLPMAETFMPKVVDNTNK